MKYATNSHCVENPKLTATTTARSFTTTMEPLDSHSAVSLALKDIKALEQEGKCFDQKAGLQKLASSAFNDIWLVNRPLKQAQRYVLRIPRGNALLPHQPRNEVAWLTFIRERLPNVPVPEVYHYSISENEEETYFIAEEFVEGETLNTVWKTFDEATKLEVSRQIAQIVVDLADTTFDGIGDLMLDHTLGPTVESWNLYKGRAKFHDSSCENIGPYKTTKEYILACYDKEISYRCKALEEYSDDPFVRNVSVEEFIDNLLATRRSIKDDDRAFVPDEPFVLLHGYLNGRNIMMRGGRIVAVLGWESAHSYPLSELLVGDGIDVMKMETKEDVHENGKCSDVIVELVGEIASSRGWGGRRLALLLGRRKYEMQKARVDMFPELCQWVVTPGFERNHLPDISTEIFVRK